MFVVLGTFLLIPVGTYYLANYIFPCKVGPLGVEDCSLANDLIKVGLPIITITSILISIVIEIEPEDGYIDDQF